MGRTRKRNKSFIGAAREILLVIKEIARAGQLGHIERDDLIRLGVRANDLIIRFGALGCSMDEQGMLHGIWSNPPDNLLKRKSALLPDDNQIGVMTCNH